MEAQGLNDLNEFERLLSEQDKKLAECEVELARWRQYAADYSDLRARLQTLPQQLTHQVTVPLGKLAFAPGRLVHTGELLVLLGDNWFAEASAASAAGIADRRLKHCTEMVARLERERALFSDWRQQADQLRAESAETCEITEPLDEATEARWRRERRARVAAARRQEAAERRQMVAALPEPHLMARLDALESREVALGEMDRLSSSDGSATDSDEESADDSIDDASEEGGSAAIDVSPARSDARAGSSAVIDVSPARSDARAGSSAAIDVSPARSSARAGRSHIDSSPARSGARTLDSSPARSGARALDSDDSDDPPTPTRRVSFAEGASTVHRYEPDAPASVSCAARAQPGDIPGPAGDGVPTGVQSPDIQAPQERPQLSQVFSYKIEERTAPASTPAPPNVAPVPASAAPADGGRPVSKFRASRSRAS